MGSRSDRVALRERTELGTFDVGRLNGPPHTHAHRVDDRIGRPLGRDSPRNFTPPRSSRKIELVIRRVGRLDLHPIGAPRGRRRLVATGNKDPDEDWEKDGIDKRAPIGE